MATNALDGTVVHCMAWDREMVTESSTTRILLGTDHCKVYKHGLLEETKETTSSTS